MQTYSSLAKEDAERAAEITAGDNDEVTVVCTPSGGAQTVRLQLTRDWMETVSDEELVKQIETAQV